MRSGTADRTRALAARAVGGDGVQVTGRAGQTPGPAARRHAPFRLLNELQRPEHVFRDLGPNWFAAVMRTGIVAIAGASLPLRLPGLRVFATVVWILAAAVLVALTAAWAVHWTRYPDRARGHAANPVMAQFWGRAAWLVVAVRTARGVATGRLFR